jgi:molybdenum cofactor cytidylyltransferase
MNFGEMPVAHAMGAILAHSVKLGQGLFRKGRVLTPADIVLLEASGIETVFAAKLEPGDVAEDTAAAAVSKAIGGKGTVVQAAFTGRANLHAGTRGLAIVDTERVKAINRLHESLTVATLPPYAAVEPREMVATVKVIPFAVPRSVFSQALDIIGERPLLRVAAYQRKRVGLVITQLPQTKPSLIAKSEDAMRERVAALDGELVSLAVTGHTTVEVGEAITQMLSVDCGVMLLFGASAIVDRGDVIPAALVKAGGEVVHLGMPVDPGNLMMLGKMGDRPVIGVPSCARSLKLNGFDWILARVMADVPVSREDIMDMGAGGLLAEIHSRPSPREKRPAVQHAPKVVGLVLAAGQSSRMGTNKLLATVHGQPMIARTVGAVSPAVDQVIAVIGRDAPEVAAALGRHQVDLVHNPDFASGLSTSLKRGLDAMPADADAVLVVLGDMPLVDAQVIDRLIAAFSPAEHRSICIPTFDGRRGNPVLWGRQHFEALRTLAGDQGARGLFDQYTDELVEVAMPDSAVLTDIDTPEALAALTSGRSSGS